MKAENKQSLMVWAIVVLAVMNITTLATIMYHQYQSENPKENTPQTQQKSEADSEKFSGRYFCDKLNLNSNQMNKFREFNPIFRQQARAITIQLTALRKQMLVEMVAAQIDTSRLNMLSDSIGDLHGKLKKLTYRYYLDMKSIGNYAQQKQLEQLFGEMFTNDMTMGFPGKGRPGKRQHGKQINN